MPDAFKHVCLIDATPFMVNAFQEAGAETLALTASPEPFFDLPAALEENGFTPDLVLQVEKLSSRSIMTGLEQVDCPLLFWAVDPHLNAYWHCAYGRLFDLVCSTQKAWMGKLARHGADVRWLPWYALDRPFVPWEQRENGLTFVGRVTDQRPARKWMVEFLEEQGAAFNPAIRDSVPYPEMMDLYSVSKIIPNESIFGEVNFRLLEGAATGCLVLGQDIEEQAELFEPGREIDTYDNIVEFDDKLAIYLNNDKLTRTMARAAHTRVQAEHLPIHRARRIMEYGHDATRNRATGRDVAKWTALAACSLWEGGQLDTDLKLVLDLLIRADQDADIIAATLRLQAVAGAPAALEDNLKILLTSPNQDSVTLNLVASMASLRVGHFNGAKTFWYRHLENTGGEVVPPDSPKTLCTLWAKDLQRRGETMRSGFNFDPNRHLPLTATECLLSVLKQDQQDQQDLDILRLLDSMYRPIVGTEQARVGFLSILTLHEREDWRLALEIGLVNLKSYRLQCGLEELQLALDIARNKGQEAAFLRVLKGRDPSRLIAKRLGL